MTDKELLEFALKASFDGEEIAGFSMAQILENPLVFDEIIKRWNPLVSDADALRLAVKLRLDIYVSGNLTEVNGPFDQFFTEAHFGDDYAATRRAIIRAAAAIGETNEHQ